MQSGQMIQCPDVPTELFANLNKYAATMHFVGESTILRLKRVTQVPE